MHVQARAQPSRSPANLVEFLQVLAADEALDRDAINIEGASGASVERGGRFVFAVTHGRARDAHDRLTDEHYRVQWTSDLYAERIPPDDASGSTALPTDDDPNRPGVLLGIVERAKGSPLAAGREIDTVLIGAFTDEPGHFFVQVTFEGSDWNEDRPEQDD